MTTNIVLEIDITLKDERWMQIKGIDNIEGLVKNIVSKVLCSHAGLSKKIKNAEASIVLCDDSFIREINREYRAKNSATNVLSFPMSNPAELENPVMDFCAFGDIILAYETILRESEEQEKPIKDHFTHMLVHGCLHLLHYDHIKNKDAQIMEKLEVDILNDMGIKNPYETY